MLIVITMIINIIIRILRLKIFLVNIIFLSISSIKKLSFSIVMDDNISMNENMNENLTIYVLK